MPVDKSLRNGYNSYNFVTNSPQEAIMADDNKMLMYKGHPLRRKGNLIYYGSMAD